MSKPHPRLPLVLTLALTLGGLTSVPVAWSQTTECEVCVTRRVVAQCKRDALEIDGARARVVGCQRELDARAGQVSLLQVQADIEVKEMRRIRDDLSREKARPSVWTGVAVGAGVVAVVWVVVEMLVNPGG